MVRENQGKGEGEGKVVIRSLPRRCRCVVSCRRIVVTVLCRLIGLRCVGLGWVGFLLLQHTGRDGLAHDEEYV